MSHDDFTPTALLLLPLYKIFHTPLLGLFLHPLILWLGGVALYFRVLRQTALSSGARLAILFSFYNCVWASLILHYHFHLEVLYVPLTFLAYGALKDRSWKWLTLWCVLYLGVKEDAPFYLAAFFIAAGFLGFIKKRTAVAASLVCLTYAVWVLKWAIPHFHQGDYELVEAVAGFGNSPHAIWANLSEILPRYLSQLFNGGWIKAGYQWLFLPWFDLFFAIFSLPFILIHNLAPDGSMRALHLHYASPFLPMLYLGVVRSFSKVSSRFRASPNRVALIFWFAFLVTQFTGSGYLVFRNYDTRWKELHRIDDQIPISATVCLQHDSLPHLKYRSDRIGFYSPQCLERKVDFIILSEHLKSSNALPEQTRAWITGLKANPNYRMMSDADGWTVFKRK
ncbi:MAG: DUF2079 domain-containing protein [Proteobacteria bacterium]|nr:MAG: DUF2079 domain-containing protein [Pseudomonadota bacterium]